MKIIVRRVLTELIYYGNMLAHYHTKVSLQTTDINLQQTFCGKVFI